jgi:hypothetical protein
MRLPNEVHAINDLIFRLISADPRNLFGVIVKKSRGMSE